MEKKLFIELVKKYLAGDASVSETALLEAYYNRLGEKKRTILSAEQEAELEERLLKDVLRQMDASTSTSGHARNAQPLHRQAWFRMAAAVVLLAVAAAALWSLYENDGRTSQAETDQGILALNPPEDLPPGGNKALLMLADGSVIVLDHTENGILAETSDAQVLKLKDGQLEYRELNSEKHSKPTYNQLSTPKGGQYQLTLPDKSKVWLNAASSIRYPTAFTGNERKVEVIGEVYFEVAKAPGQTFKVVVPSSSGDTEIEVLGTHFNIKAYKNEANIQTTLLEGSVKLRKGRKNAILEPGQQAEIGRGTIHVLNDIDTEGAIAWKKGLFQFDDAKLADILKQLERWYDAEVDYENIPELHFKGTISRQAYLSQVLRMLEITSNVRFDIVDKKIKIVNTGT